MKKTTAGASAAAQITKIHFYFEVVHQENYVTSWQETNLRSKLKADLRPSRCPFVFLASKNKNKKIKGLVYIKTWTPPFEFLIFFFAFLGQKNNKRATWSPQTRLKFLSLLQPISTGYIVFPMHDFKKIMDFGRLHGSRSILSHTTFIHMLLRSKLQTTLSNLPYPLKTRHL